MIHLLINISLMAGEPQQGVQVSQAQSNAVRVYVHELVKLHLVRSYREWSRFRASHPGRYQREAKRIVDQIQGEIVSTCACGDRESVLRELREFAAAFPESPVTAAVQDRIKELERDSSDLRFHCISG